MTMLKKQKLFGLIIILILGINLAVIAGLTPLLAFNQANSDQISDTIDKKIPKTSLPSSNYKWWNKSWSFRVGVGITAVGNQSNAPVELEVNFTKYFKDLNVQNAILNTSTIRVIEYLSSTKYYEVECQFDPYPHSFDNKTNAIGDVIWILNGTTNNGQTRNFFIYFENGTNPSIPEPNYNKIRLWHEGFEDFNKTDLLRPSDGQDNYHPDAWEISNTTSARGHSSLKIWGNCWKALSTGTININPNIYVTAKMRFDDPDILREISGIGFKVGYSSIPGSGDSYNIRGNQAWGSAGSYKFRNQYYSPNTFFWYTLHLDPEISSNSFDHIFIIADDDSYTNLDLYWDDISIWATQVQTTPNNSLSIELGNIQPISFTLEVTCKDDQGNPVPNAHIFITNDANPQLNQDNYSDSNGKWIFSDIAKDGLYNITINYTQNGLTNPKTKTVFFMKNYAITTLHSAITAYLNITTYTFNVTDVDKDPVGYGYVQLKSGNDIVGKATLDSNGECTIRWLNNTSYKYEVYFDYSSLTDNSKYRYNDLLIFNDTTGSNHDFDVSTKISKITFNVTDATPEKVPFTNARLRFYNQTDYDNENEIIANVTVDINGLAKFISFTDSYKKWGNYTVDIYFGGEERDFHANGSAIGHEYNFTLHSESYVKIEIPLNKDLYNSTVSIISLTTNIVWGEDVNVQFNFTKRDPLVPAPTKVTPNEIYIQILDQELTVYSQKIDVLSAEISTGVFNYTFNSKDFNLIGGTSYYIDITGNYKSYVFNSISPKQFIVQSKTTGIRYYNYSLHQLTNKEISVIYNQPVNITIDYYDFDSGTHLSGATITYSWDYGSGYLSIDPKHSGYYYFEFDSSLAPSAAQYIIDINAQLQNYSSIEDSLLIKILERPTIINGTSNIFQLAPKIYVKESVNFSFVFKDTLTNQILTNLDTAVYHWYKLDSSGNPLTGPGNEGSGTLSLGNNNHYILDFNTESRDVGEYSIFITLQKKNYELRNAFISLTISKRPITIDVMNITGLSGKQITIVQGNPITFRISLKDNTNNSKPLINANVSLIIGTRTYSLNEVQPGVYEYVFSTDDIDAFFMPQTFTCELRIEKTNYETQTIPLTIVVGMTEIFPGFPMFYFFLLIGGIVAVVGSLVIYRTVQQARIPTFVKKVRSMKKLIKGRKSIPDSLLYPTKEEYIVKMFEEKWNALGISLRDIMGIETKQKRKSSEKLSMEGGEA